MGRIYKITEKTEYLIDLDEVNPDLISDNVVTDYLGEWMEGSIDDSDRALVYFENLEEGEKDNYHHDCDVSAEEDC